MHHPRVNATKLYWPFLHATEFIYPNSHSLYTLTQSTRQAARFPRLYRRMLLGRCAYTPNELMIVLGFFARSNDQIEICEPFFKGNFFPSQPTRDYHEKSSTPVACNSDNSCVQLDCSCVQLGQQLRDI